MGGLEDPLYAVCEITMSRSPERVAFHHFKKSERFKQWFRKEMQRIEGVCVECQSYMTTNKTEKWQPDLATVDHIIPLEQGGTNDFSNLRIICQKDNYTKGLSEQPKNLPKTYKRHR